MEKEQFLQDLKNRGLEMAVGSDHSEDDDPIFWIQSLTDDGKEEKISPSFLSLPELIEWWEKNKAKYRV